ncbi:MAG: hypothetical protein HS111_13625 [Kofleriaceae bacterium]|nr:hypothetical protein [Kofleriaceae bacterium]
MSIATSTTVYSTPLASPPSVTEVALPPVAWPQTNVSSRRASAAGRLAKVTGVPVTSSGLVMVAPSSSATPAPHTEATVSKRVAWVGSSWAGAPPTAHRAWK